MRVYRLGAEISRAIKANQLMQINSQNWKQQQQQNLFWENVDVLPAKKPDYCNFPSASGWEVSCFVTTMKIGTLKLLFSDGVSFMMFLVLCCILKLKEKDLFSQDQNVIIWQHCLTIRWHTFFAQALICQTKFKQLIRSVRASVSYAQNSTNENYYEFLSMIHYDNF